MRAHPPDGEQALPAGGGVLELARALSDPFIERARPALQSAADASGFSAMLNLAEDEALVVVLCATPRAPGMHLTTPPGLRLVADDQLGPRDVAGLKVTHVVPNEHGVVER
jgi:hypothetical protein